MNNLEVWINLTDRLLSTVNNLSLFNSQDDEFILNDQIIEAQQFINDRVDEDDKEISLALNQHARN